MRVLLTSVLKPVTDPRLNRLARALAQMPGADVHILASPSQGRETKPLFTNITYHELTSFTRLNINRTRAGSKLLSLTNRIRPHVLVIGAAELLPAGLRWKRATGGRLVYDVRENYALNVRTQGVFPALVAAPLAAAIRFTEERAARSLDGVLLAERSYTRELPWLGHTANVEIIENKYLQDNKKSDESQVAISLPEVPPLRLAVTGTLNALYGTYRAISLADELIELIGPAQLSLQVVGHCPRVEDLQRLQVLAATRPWLTLQAAAQPVSHSTIINTLRGGSASLLPYLPHPSLDNCIPTKLWECLGEGVPVVVPPNPLWAEIVNRHRAGLVLDYEAPQAAATLLAGLQTGSFYPDGPPAEAFWEPEAAKVRAFFAALGPFA